MTSGWPVHPPGQPTSKKKPRQAKWRGIHHQPLTGDPMYQPALFTDDDVQTEGYAQPEPRDDEAAVEETEHEVEAA